MTDTVFPVNARDTVFPLQKAREFMWKTLYFYLDSCQRHCISSHLMRETLYFQSTHARDTVFPVKTAREFMWETLEFHVHSCERHCISSQLLWETLYFHADYCERHCISSQLMWETLHFQSTHARDTVFPLKTAREFMWKTLYFYLDSCQRHCTSSQLMRETVFPVKTAREFMQETLYLQSILHKWRGNMRDAGSPVNSSLMTWHAPTHVLCRVSKNCDGVCYTLVIDTKKILTPYMNACCRHSVCDTWVIHTVHVIIQTVYDE